MRRHLGDRTPWALPGTALVLGITLALPSSAAAADAPLLRPGVFGGRVQNRVRLDFGLGYPVFAPRLSYAHRAASAAST